MRGVGVRGSLLACVSAAAILFQFQVSARAAEQVATLPPEAGTPSHPSTDDYYTRRAQSILKAEKSAQLKPHPLAKSYPGMDIVVCEGGCRARRRVDVVYMRPTPAPIKSATESSMIPTSADGMPVSAQNSAACVAGCYGRANRDGDFQLRALLAREPAPARRAAKPPRDPLSPIR